MSKSYEKRVSPSKLGLPFDLDDIDENDIYIVISIIDKLLFFSESCPYCHNEVPAYNGHTDDCSYMAKRKELGIVEFTGLSDLLDGEQ